MAWILSLADTLAATPPAAAQTSDSTWMPTLVGTLGAALIAATALLTQNWRTGKRDDKRREDDAAERDRERTHQREMAAAEHKRRVANMWRERRLEMHAAALTAIEDLYVALRTYSTTELMATMLDSEATFDFGRLNWAALDELSTQASRSVSQLRLLVSEESLRLLLEAHDILVKTVVSLRIRFLRRPDDLAPWLREYVTKIGEYQTAARRELGTTD